MLDTLARPLRDLRISVTDRCNFRCVYCMPKEVFGRDYRFLPRRELLTFEEIERVARVFVGLGVQKLRITGGEPLLRRDLEVLIARLAAIGDLDLTLTTNAALLAQKAQALAEAGLTRVTVSLDSLDDEVFRTMNDVDFPVARVLAGIDAAAEAGLPVKVNVVVKRGLNEGSVLDIARRFRGTGHPVRFIEYMDVGATNGWRMDDVVPAAEIVAAIGAEFPLEPVEAAYRGEVAERYRYLDGAGEIGVIASVTQPFCGDCTRARISADGKLYTCLFAAAWARPARDPPLGRRRTGARGGDPRRLGAPHRPLLGAPHGADRRPAQGRDVVHRRLAARRRLDAAGQRSAPPRARPRPGSSVVPLERTIRATETTTAAPATAICTVISSPEQHPAEEDGDDRVHVRIGGDERDRSGAEEPDVGREADERSRDDEVAEREQRVAREARLAELAEHDRRRRRAGAPPQRDASPAETSGRFGSGAPREYSDPAAQQSALRTMTSAPRRSTEPSPNGSKRNASPANPSAKPT